MPTITDPLKITTTPEDEEAHADGDVFASKDDEDDEPAEHPMDTAEPIVPAEPSPPDPDDSEETP